MDFDSLPLKEKIYYKDNNTVIYLGDCREIKLEKISSIVTDPPYELGFMNKKWDSQGVSFQRETWERLRSYCLPSSPLISFGGSRTYHRIACAIEDAGFEIRDCIMWVYGSGFPKSLDISKAIDKQQGIKRDVLGYTENARPNRIGKETKLSGLMTVGGEITKPVTPEAKLWEGYGTALKPAYEPIILGMNPLEGTFANNALKYGVAGLNIDECRIEYQSDDDFEMAKGGDSGSTQCNIFSANGKKQSDKITPKGRFPANFIHDGSQMVMELFPNSKSSGGQASLGAFRNGDVYGKGLDIREKRNPGFGDNGSAARFFYCAKSSRSERNYGLGNSVTFSEGNRPNSPDETGKFPDHDHRQRGGNNHPTVKPLALMEYLVKLIKMPQYNLILDPFCGSGTTLLACKKLGLQCIGIDNDEKSCEIAANRCKIPKE